MLAYERLTRMLFDHSDRAKLEWSIGSMLMDGPSKILIICGPAATGKSTALRIVGEIAGHFGMRDQVILMHEGFQPPAGPGRIFAATNEPARIDNLGMIIAQTSGRVFPSYEYNRLMAEIESELGDIAHICAQRFNAMGHNYYETVFVNNLQRKD